MELIAKSQFVQGTNIVTAVLSVDNARSDTFRISGSTDVNQSRSVMGFLPVDRDISKKTGYMGELETYGE